MLSSPTRIEFLQGAASTIVQKISAATTMRLLTSLCQSCTPSRVSSTSFSKVLTRKGHTQVPRLQSVVRDRRANWEQSLATLRAAKAAGARITKTSIMLGCGENPREVTAAMQELRDSGKCGAAGSLHIIVYSASRWLSGIQNEQMQPAANAPKLCRDILGVWLGGPILVCPAMLHLPF